MFYLFSL